MCRFILNIYLSYPRFQRSPHQLIQILLHTAIQSGHKQITQQLHISIEHTGKITSNHFQVHRTNRNHQWSQQFYWSQPFLGHIHEYHPINVHWSIAGNIYFLLSSTAFYSIAGRSIACDYVHRFANRRRYLIVQRSHIVRCILCDSIALIRIVDDLELSGTGKSHDAHAELHFRSVMLIREVGTSEHRSKSGGVAERFGCVRDPSEDSVISQAV